MTESHEPQPRKAAEYYRIDRLADDEWAQPIVCWSEYNTLMVNNKIRYRETDFLNVENKQKGI